MDKWWRLRPPPGVSMKIKVDDKVALKRDIYRTSHITREVELYASKGETGSVENVFPSSGSGHMSKDVRWNAKVRIGNVLKTFRVTSLEVV